jgi:predicted nucleic acid-binding protein
MGQPQRHLIDSNVVIDYLAEKLSQPGLSFVSQVIDSLPQVSIITKMEVLGYNAPPDSEALIKNFINDVLVIHLTEEIINQTIALRKGYRIKLPDAIIAATAIVFDLTLVTRNVSDFKMIDGLNLVNPSSL